MKKDYLSSVVSVVVAGETIGNLKRKTLKDVLPSNLVIEESASTNRKKEKKKSKRRVEIKLKDQDKQNDEQLEELYKKVKELLESKIRSSGRNVAMKRGRKMLSRQYLKRKSK